MARSYTVKTIGVNSDTQLLVDMGWTYGDPAEQFSAGGNHKLSDEAQVPAVGLTQVELVAILEADLPNTSAQFDATIDAQIAAAAVEEEIVEVPAPESPTPENPLPLSVTAASLG